MEIDKQTTKLEYSLKPIDKKLIDSLHANTIKNGNEKIKESTEYLWDLITKKIIEECQKNQKTIDIELAQLHRFFPKDSTQIDPSFCDYDKIMDELEKTFGPNSVQRHNIGSKRFQYTPDHNISLSGSLAVPVRTKKLKTLKTLPK